LGAALWKGNFQNAIMGCCRIGQASAGKEIHMKEASEQVVELFRVSASVVCCCPGAAKMPALRQRHDALAPKFFLQVP
jgi:hypothetical protein